MNWQIGEIAAKTIAAPPEIIAKSRPEAFFLQRNSTCLVFAQPNFSL
jgi:hypothetical protein